MKEPKDLYEEYAEVSKKYKFSVETERRFYLCNVIEFNRVDILQNFYFDVKMKDAWVMDGYRTNRTLKQAHIVTSKDVNIEEL